MEDTPLKYDIFSGIPEGGDAVWVETTEGLAGALERMEQIAEETAGPYFVFYAARHSVVARMDTSFRLRKSKGTAA